MNIIITGGKAKNSTKDKKFNGDFTCGLISRVDLNSGSVSEIFSYNTNIKNRPTPTSSDLFKTSSMFGDNCLVVPTKTEVLMFDLKTQSVLKSFSSELLNDVHHAVADSDKIGVVSTGLDSVIWLSQHDCTVVDIWNVNKIQYQKKFSQKKDWRQIESLKPHDYHPNFLIKLDSNKWGVTCLKNSSVYIFDEDRFFNISNVPIHDGVKYLKNYYFTSVDGTVIITDLQSRKKTIDLKKIEGRSNLGWCRGIEVIDKDTVVVGFSVLRTTQWKENLKWVKSKLDKVSSYSPLETRLVVYNLKTESKIFEVDLSFHGFGAIFGIHKAIEL